LLKLKDLNESYISRDTNIFKKFTQKDPICKKDEFYKIKRQLEELFEI